MDIDIAARKFYDYSRHVKGFSPDTIKRYAKVLTIYKNFSQATTLEEITEGTLLALFLHGRTVRNWRAATYIAYHLSLGVFFKWCITHGYMQSNPLVNIELPKLEKRIPSKLTKQDALRILETINNYSYGYKFTRYRNYALFATFMFAGLRKSELLKLRCADIDIENLTLFVNQGKGAKDRIIPISYTLAESLKKYAAERKRLNRTCPEFFASSTRNVGFTIDGLKHLVVHTRKISGIRFNVHKLRHTFATLMLEGGCDIYSLSRMMGHSDIKTTTIYLSASAEHLRSQMTKHPLNDLVR